MHVVVTGICSAAGGSETPSLHLKLKNLFKLHVWWTLSTRQAESWHRICPHFCILNVSEWLTTLFKLKLGDSSFKSSDVSCGRVFNQVPCPRDVSHAHLQSLSSQSPAFPSHCSCVSSYPIRAPLTASYVILLPLGSIPVRAACTWWMYHTHH